MTAETIRNIPLRTEVSEKIINTKEAMSLEFQLTQLVFLREIAAQLAELNESYRLANRRYIEMTKFEREK